MTTRRNACSIRLRMLAGTVFLAASVHGLPSSAQGLNEQQAVDRIVGSEVREAQVRSGAGDERVIAAIESLNENIDTVRKVTKLERVDFVYLPDASKTEGGPPRKIASKLSEHSEAVNTLRHELEGNALLYHAINSRNLLIQDVLAIEFDDGKHMTIFAAAKPPQ